MRGSMTDRHQPHTVDRTRIVRSASFIALAGNVLLCAVKLTAGFITGSLAVLGDGLDTATDVGIAIMAVIVSFVINKPSDTHYPWGRQRAETVASLVLAFIIMLAGIQLCIAAMNRLIQVYGGAVLPMPQRIALLATSASIIGKLLLALNQYLLGKKANSLMILANARNMVNDIIISSSVLIGCILSILLHAPYLDPVIALLVSFWIMKSAVTLFIDIEVDGVMSVNEAHIIAEKITLEIKERIGNVYDVVLHVEPYNSNRNEESYGLSLKDLKKAE